MLKQLGDRSVVCCWVGVVDADVAGTPVQLHHGDLIETAAGVVVGYADLAVIDQLIEGVLQFLLSFDQQG